MNRQLNKNMDTKTDKQYEQIDKKYGKKPTGQLADIINQQTEKKIQTI